MRGSVQRRFSIQLWYGQLHDRLTTWAADKRTSPALLRQALADILACGAMAPSEQDSLKSSYLDVNRLLDSPKNPAGAVPSNKFQKHWNPNNKLTREEVQKLWDAWRFWRREPERSRRVIRLLAANWLAYLDQPSQNRPKPDPTIAAFDIYPLGPQSSPEAHTLSPEALESWFESAHDAQEFLRYLSPTAVQTLERTTHGEILMLLASELYRRDHQGANPLTPEVLVGPYLERLPNY